MSWDVTLNNQDGQPVSVDNHSEGGTYALGAAALGMFAPPGPEAPGTLRAPAPGDAGRSA